ncbi:hypothetical protein CYMTET_50849 [Cymbomonas tetramitiformis]|uniref:Cyclic nucleotide-binding domain-containing protein n=1 Tax=Cymbomonas tetramitiformis TaxID=36881 RepID=A0AAE0ESE2_9CHLO|nr:hypothetical protein CYMTET_50849 [Cymbomonas tetramitiformis]
MQPRKNSDKQPNRKEASAEVKEAAATLARTLAHSNVKAFRQHKDSPESSPSKTSSRNQGADRDDLAAAPVGSRPADPSKIEMPAGVAAENALGSGIRRSFDAEQPSGREAAGHRSAQDRDAGKKGPQPQQPSRPNLEGRGAQPPGQAATSASGGSSDPDITRVLQGLKIFEGAPADLLAGVAKAGRVEEKALDEVVVRPAKSLTNLVLVIQGRLQEFNQHGQVVGSLSSGAYFGDLQLIFNLPQLYEVRAATQSTIVVFPISALGTAFHSFPQTWHSLEKAARERLQSVKHLYETAPKHVEEVEKEEPKKQIPRGRSRANATVKPTYTYRVIPPELIKHKLGLIFSKMPLFQDLPVKLAMALSNVAEVRKYEAGQLVVEQGDLGTEMYVTLDGKLQASLNNGTVVGDLGPFELFGIALMLLALPTVSPAPTS